MGEASVTRIVTIGAALSANKGAASMLYAVVQNLPEYLGPCRFDVLTTYPEQDAEESTPGEVRLVPATPVLMLIMFRLALVAWAVRTLRLPSRWLHRTPAMRAIAAQRAAKRPTRPPASPSGRAPSSIGKNERSAAVRGNLLIRMRRTAEICAR